jgi:hypothetical protein
MCVAGTTAGQLSEGNFASVFCRGRKTRPVETNRPILYLLGFGTFKVSLDTEQCYLKLSDLKKVKQEEKMPVADHRSALIRVIEILSKNGRFDCKEIGRIERQTE